MNKLLEKTIKRENKKRGLNITIATMVIFILGSIEAIAEEKSTHIQIPKIENSKVMDKIQLESQELVVENLVNSGKILGVDLKSQVQQSGIDNFLNMGIIEDGVSVKWGELKGYIGKYQNYGIVSGKEPVYALTNEKDMQLKDMADKGIAIKVSEDGQIEKIEMGTNGNVTIDGKDYTVTNSDKGIELDQEKVNQIINGVDLALKVNGNTTLSDSIVNGYGAGVEIKDGATFTGNNIVVNGGKSASILGTAGDNNLVLTGDTYINGNIDLKDGNDKIILGTIKGENRSNGNPNIVIDGKINGANNIEVNQNVTLTGNSQVTGTDNITISKDGNLILELKKDGEKAESALTNSNVTVVGTGEKGSGNLVFDSTGVGTGIKVDMSGVKLEDVSVTVDNSMYQIANNNGGELEISVEGELGGVIENENNSGGTIQLPNGYETLNAAYVSMINNGDNINYFNEKFGNKNVGENLITYTKEVTFMSPYAISNELSKKSADGMANIVVDSNLKPELKKWAVTGGLTHRDGEFATEGLLGTNTQLAKYNQNVESKMTGLYTLGEYGVKENLSLGIVFGANNVESKLSNGSNVDGTTIYLGGFAKKYIGNLRLTLGAGYQYGDYQADRYSLGENLNGADYQDSTINVYTEAKYSHMLKNNFFLEPSLGLNYTYISQEGTSEKGKLGIETDSKEFNTTTARLGLDVRKEFVTRDIKHGITVGAFYDKILDGEKSESITGRFVGGKDFDILVAGKNRDSVGARVKYSVELKNGVSVETQGSYLFARDSYQGDTKYDNKGEWRVGVGLGYKF